VNQTIVTNASRTFSTELLGVRTFRNLAYSRRSNFLRIDLVRSFVVEQETTRANLDRPLVFH
jgi:hypothetical protein